MSAKRTTSTSIDTDQVEPAVARLPEPQRLATARNGMVATQHYHATAAGVEILEAGGNAFDAAAAAAFALGVCEPAASGLGGQTMALIHAASERKTIALDGSSRAPNRATPEVLLSKGERLRGYRSSSGEISSTSTTRSRGIERRRLLRQRSP